MKIIRSVFRIIAEDKKFYMKTIRTGEGILQKSRIKTINLEEQSI